jgi:Asp-tRNA(Asn)/Glu-tRNA(Gln) amidotransferase A subunit family amidase
MSKTFRYLSIVIFLVIGGNCIAQSKRDSIKQVQNFGKYYDLNFTEAEVDSLLGSLIGFTATYKALHSRDLANNVPFPFAFNPAPYGYKVPTDQKPINWKLPANVSLPANRNDLAFYSIPQLASLIKNKKVSSVELTRFFLSRLRQWDDTLEAVITFTEELAIKQARQADDELKRGIYRGPLHGIPYGLKDLFAVKGYKTTFGSTPYKDQVIEQDAFVYTQLRKAGAVLCAKLSLGALAYDNKWFGGETKNPWLLTQGSSGSSAGSAAATAAGLLPFAIGTETLGSIVSPSTRCGITGLRPSFGSVSRNGGMVLCWSLDKVGPMCRSAEDAAIVFAAIKGDDGRDHGAVEHAFNYSQTADVKKLKIAYAKNYFDARGVDSMQHKVLRDFEAMGVKLIPVTFPDSAMYPFDLIGPVLYAESGAAFDPLTRNSQDDLIERQDKNFWPNIFRSSRFIPAVEYIEINRHRYNLCVAMNDFMKDYDVVIFPGSGGRQLSITNLTGHPVVCLPVGFRSNGTPMSATFMGKLYDEVSILTAAKAFQDKTDHHKKRPPLFSK